MYYTRVIDPSMYLAALNEILIIQSTPTSMTLLVKCNQLLDCIAWHPNITIHFHTSDMILNVDSDTAYLVLPRADWPGTFFSAIYTDPQSYRSSYWTHLNRIQKNPTCSHQYSQSGERLQNKSSSDYIGWEIVSLF